MNNIEHGKIFETIVEIDETYIGGKPRKKNRKDDDDKPNKRGRGTKKNPVVGIVDRKKKKVYAKVSLPNKEGKKLSGNQLLGILNEICKSNATVITDEFAGYSILRKTEYVHLVIDHTKGFVNDFVHTNNVESFWAILKRGVYGIYHHRDVKEFALFFKNLKRMSKLTWGQIQQAHDFNAHPVSWKLRTLPSWVRQLPETLKAYQLFQFKAFKECRIFGFFDSNCIFEVLFVDRGHRIYPPDG